MLQRIHIVYWSEHRIMDFAPEKNISYRFIQYVRPIWYFHLIPFDDTNNVWIEYDQLTESEKQIIISTHCNRSVVSHRFPLPNSISAMKHGEKLMVRPFWDFGRLRL